MSLRIALGVEYFGLPFRGWQSQRCGVTVQDALETALAAIAGSPTATLCAGRTDAGVHAIQQVVHFDTEVERPLDAWVRGVNSHLPEGVAVRWARVVDPHFHARFSAQARRYRYLLLNRAQRPGLWQGRVGWAHQPLSLENMQDAAQRLLGEHDFSAFRAAQCQAKSPVKLMHEARIVRRGELFVFDFMASAFLHHMVRNLVGALVYVGKGAQPPAWIEHLLQARDRTQAAPTFSAAGLYFRGPVYAPSWGFPEAVDAFVDDETGESAWPLRA
ncbi:tRNA pseudouridine(38-40) synthase TruA [Azonexus sp.]|uniref:tRNA pseudouridine(38-40) synthase TruA n=1 Tax=Azonexus sp. TaxID=1872668 RepID=UPI0039E409B1